MSKSDYSLNIAEQKVAKVVNDFMSACGEIFVKNFSFTYCLSHLHLHHILIYRSARGERGNFCLSIHEGVTDFIPLSLPGFS